MNNGNMTEMQHARILNVRQEFQSEILGLGTSNPLLTNPPGDSDVHSSLRTTGLNHSFAKGGCGVVQGHSAVADGAGARARVHKVEPFPALPRKHPLGQDLVLCISAEHKALRTLGAHLGFQLYSFQQAFQVQEAAHLHLARPLRLPLLPSDRNCCKVLDHTLGVHCLPSPGFSAVDLKVSERDFPGGPVVKNPPCNARDAGSIPGQGTKIPHAAGQPSPHTITTELARLN